MSNKFCQLSSVASVHHHQDFVNSAKREISEDKSGVKKINFHFPPSISISFTLCSDCERREDKAREYIK